jgi:hypothetical protein
MARSTYGATLADYVVQPSDGLWAVAPNTVITFWDAWDGGAQYTDLLDADSVPITEVVADTQGFIPLFFGPDRVTGMWADAGGGSRAWMQAHTSSAGAATKGLVIAAPAGAVSYVIWRAPRACTVTAVHGYRQGGTGATINATKNGVDLAATDLSLSTDATWMTAPALQNTAVETGDTLAVTVRSTTGAPTAVTIQIDVEGA